MLFTEANTKNLKPTKNGNFYDPIHKRTYYYHYACMKCGKAYLDTRKNIPNYCSGKCALSGEGHPMYNKNFSEETKQKMSDAKKGKYCGKNNSNWKGGISCEPYCTQWTDKEYKDWLKYERDESRCQNPLCNGKTSRLCLHHINYDKKDCRPVNLITLCNSCNGRANKDREWHEAWYAEIIDAKLNIKEARQSLASFNQFCYSTTFS